MQNELNIRILKKKLSEFKQLNWQTEINSFNTIFVGYNNHITRTFTVKCYDGFENALAKAVEYIEMVEKDGFLGKGFPMHKPSSTLKYTKYF